MRKAVLALVAGSLLLGIGLGAYAYLRLPDVTVLQTQEDWKSI